ncbi:hypothetical protein BDV93DRAFT_562213 [Ceratobasidium sp. AG-I]|nr:hypothetical protein BDV93DRAFT_562213 [Ceratobasidium sp. AG-I]
MDLTRFNVYAPWVQRLEVFSDMTLYKLQYSRRLIDIIARQPLLPHLRTLSLSTEHDVPSRYYDSIIELLVCPTLVEIRHMSDSCPEIYLEPPSAHLLIQKISKSCPSLQRLGVYPYVAVLLHDGSSSLVSSPDAAFPKILTGLLNLRSFSGTVFILKPAVLQALASLPLLESLEIVDHDPDEQRSSPLDEHPQAIDTWFPALRNMQLYDLHPQDVTAIWSRVPLVRNLLEVTVRCYPAASQDDQTELPNGQEWINMFLSRLTRASPRIKELDLEFSSLTGQSQIYSLSGVREALRQLPLRSKRLYFSGCSLAL